MWNGKLFYFVASDKKLPDEAFVWRFFTYFYYAINFPLMYRVVRAIPWYSQVWNFAKKTIQFVKLWIIQRFSNCRKKFLFQPRFNTSLKLFIELATKTIITAISWNVINGKLANVQKIHRVKNCHNQKHTYAFIKRKMAEN